MSSSMVYLPQNDHVKIKTGIVCTIGAKTQAPEKLKSLIEAGMNVMRMNFSHGTHEYHAQTIQNLKKALDSMKEKKTVAVMLDTKGPEIRTGKLRDGKDVRLEKGKKFVFYLDQSFVGDENGVAMSYLSLPSTVDVGSIILVDDGLIGLSVTSVFVDRVECVVENEGMLGETKGVNLPGLPVDLPAITEKDHQDLLFGVEHEVDLIAASFIRKAADVLAIRDVVGPNIMIISKIESQEGLENFDEILEVSDGIMVARGDLGVEIPVEQVARAQKRMIRACNFAGKPCITATQMLESMIVNPRPTRAEATDVYNAILDGTDCVMLSGETAKGAHPVAAVEIMSKICREAELDINYSELYSNLRQHITLPISVSEAVASSAVKTSWDVHAAMMIVLTQSGQTARSISKYRPIAPVLAVTSHPRVARQMVICRGIYPMLVESMSGKENLFHQAMLHGVQMGMAVKGDPVVVTSGYIENVSGSTNMLKVVGCVGFEV